MRKYLLIALLFKSALVAEIEFPEEHFHSLGDLLNRLASESPQLEVEEHRVTGSEGDLMRARAARRPRVSLYGRVAQEYISRSDIDSETKLGGYGSLTVVQPLWYWGGLQKAEASARNWVKVNEMAVDSMSLYQQNQLRQLYLNWLLMVRRAEVLEQGRGLDERFQQVSREMAEAGYMTSYEVSEIEIRLQERREEIVRLQRDMRRAELEIRSLTGIYPGQLEHPESFFAERIMSLDELFAVRQRKGLPALENLPSAQRMAEMAKGEANRYESQRKETYPRLDFVTGVYTDRLDSVNAQESATRLQYFAGVQFSWNVWDSKANKGTLQSTLARQRIYETEAQIEEDRLEREVERLWAEVEHNIRQRESRLSRLSLLDRRLEYVRTEGGSNRVSAQDVLRVELDYENTHLWVMEAEASYWINLGHLASYYQQLEVSN